MRPGEVEGKEYYFLSRDGFKEKIKAEEFLEWAEFGGNLYGTLKSEILPPITRGEIVIAEIEIQGVEQLRTILPTEVMTTVYIESGGWDELRRRALARASMSNEELEQRYERYLVEVQTKDWADVVIDNTGDDFTPACKRFAEFIESLYGAQAKK
jgi:guanylate kinase